MDFRETEEQLALRKAVAELVQSPFVGDLHASQKSACAGRPT